MIRAYSANSSILTNATGKIGKPFDLEARTKAAWDCDTWRMKDDSKVVGCWKSYETEKNAEEEDKLQRIGLCPLATFLSIAVEVDTA